LSYLNKLGKPNLKIAGLQIWVHGREDRLTFGTNNPGDDWLLVTMHCSRDSSEVWVKNEGAISVYYDVKTLIGELEKFENNPTDKVTYQFTEPYLALEFNANPIKTDGEMEIKVDITPTQLFEHHSYYFGITEKEVKDLLLGLKNLLIEYPVSGIYK
jgi:hypothetical protein